MTLEEINVEIKNGIATITLDNPKTMNAITIGVINEMVAVLEELENNEDVKVVVLTGAGKMFSSGGDIGFFAKLLAKGESLPEDGIENIGKVVSKLREIPKPTIAAINGVAAGAGCSLALACDFRIMVEEAQFIEAFINLALSGDSGSLYFLNAMLGYAKTTELMMLGAPVSATDAKKLGILTDTVPASEFEAAVTKFATRLANGPLGAYARQKELINFINFNQSFQDYLMLEVKHMKESSKSDDFKEGVLAFVEKRAPKFTGK